jgi:hypothetical protein
MRSVFVLLAVFAAFALASQVEVEAKDVAGDVILLRGSVLRYFFCTVGVSLLYLFVCFFLVLLSFCVLYFSFSLSFFYSSAFYNNVFLLLHPFLPLHRPPSQPYHSFS